MKKDHSSVNHWSVKDLVAAINGESSKRAVFIPPFQRNVVWRDDKRRDFIESLKKGFPFGSLLLSGTNTEGGKFQLIDGLQRTNTILEYYKKRTQFVNDDEIRMHSKTIQDIMDVISLPDINRDVLIQVIGSWIRDRQDFDSGYGYTAYQLSREILEKFEKEGNVKTFDALEDVLNPFMKELKEEADIDNIQIPIVTYTGPEEDLATIFEKINSQGTTLNKYQIFAAAWSGEEYQIYIDRTEKILKYSKFSCPKLFCRHIFIIVTHL